MSLKSKNYLTILDNFLEIIAWVLIFSLWYYAKQNYKNLPHHILVQYNTEEGSKFFLEKWYILTYPLVATLIFVIITLFSKFIQIFYPPIVNNSLIVTNYEKRLLKFIKINIVLTFGLITYQTIRHAKENTVEFGIWLLPTFFVLIYLPVIYYTYKSLKKDL